MKTAVDYLDDYIQKEINKYRYAPMDLSAIMALSHIKDFAIEQAKQMEKEQIIDAWDNGYVVMPYKNGEHYYNENYKNRNNEMD